MNKYTTSIATWFLINLSSAKQTAFLSGSSRDKPLKYSDKHYDSANKMQTKDAWFGSKVMPDIEYNGQSGSPCTFLIDEGACTAKGTKCAVATKEPTPEELSSLQHWKLMIKKGPIG